MNKTMMVQKNGMFQQREKVTGCKPSLVHIVFEFHTGVLKQKFCVKKNNPKREG